MRKFSKNCKASHLWKKAQSPNNSLFLYGKVEFLWSAGYKIVCSSKLHNITFFLLSNILFVLKRKKSLVGVSSVLFRKIYFCPGEVQGCSVYSTGGTLASGPLQPIFHIGVCLRAKAWTKLSQKLPNAVSSSAGFWHLRQSTPERKQWLQLPGHTPAHTPCCPWPQGSRLGHTAKQAGLTFISP